VVKSLTSTADVASRNFRLDKILTANKTKCGAAEAGVNNLKNHHEHALQPDFLRIIH
jgi:hypothetical protein